MTCASWLQQGVRAGDPQAAPAVETVDVLGLRVAALNLEEVVAAAAVALTEGRPLFIAAANPEKAIKAGKDRELASTLGQADLLIPDGAGIVLAARVLGRRLPERVTGVDLMQALVVLAWQQGYPVYFLGGQDGVATAAAARLTERYQGLVVAGTHHGYFAQDEEGQLVAEIRRLGTRVLFVGLGSPRQEKWLSRYLSQLGPVVALGVGGGLDVFSGRVKRAPAFYRRMGLEWAYRTIKEPRRRLGRSLNLPLFAWRVFGQAVTSRWHV